MNHKILIVDDEPANLRLLERLFRAHYQVMTASSGGEALELLGQFDVAVIISDQRMPGMTGIEFLKRAAQMRSHTVRIILTGYTDVNALVEAINSGVVYKYVSKPWSNEDLLQTVVRALEHHEMNKRQHDLTLHSERLASRLTESKHGFIRLVAELLDLKDGYAHNHARRVVAYAAAIGQSLDLENEDAEQLELAAYLHESGNIALPDELLFKTFAANGKDLTDEESALAGRGAAAGARMLAVAPEWDEIALAARHYRELFGGGGLPDDLSGEQIPLFARIIAVACAYDKITCAREREKSLTHEEAIEKLLADDGKLFDPNLALIFSRLKAIGRVRQTISEGFTGMRLHPSRIFTDPKTFSTAELLQKFKTEPMMALDVLKSANGAGGGAEKTADLMAAMSALGEEKLRHLVEQNGLPASDAKFDGWSRRAVRRALVARLLAAHSDIVQPEEAYTLGLLYDVGEILLGSLFPEDMLALEKIDDETVRVRRQIEIFGLDSIQASQWMLEAVGLPPEHASAVKMFSELTHINNPLTLLLHTAHKIAGKEELTKPTGDVIDTDKFAPLKLTRAELYQIYERASAISDSQVEALRKV